MDPKENRPVNIVFSAVFDRPEVETIPFDEKWNKPHEQVTHRNGYLVTTTDTPIKPGVVVKSQDREVYKYLLVGTRFGTIVVCMSFDGQLPAHGSEEFLARFYPVEKLKAIIGTPDGPYSNYGAWIESFYFPPEVVGTLVSVTMENQARYWFNQLVNKP
jgi:hypothetical protein